MKQEKGWGLDVTSKKVNHYYINGFSACGKQVKLFHVDNLVESTTWTPILGYNCTKCTKIINK